jgi:hypothetical protein
MLSKSKMALTEAGLKHAPDADLLAPAAPPNGRHVPWLRLEAVSIVAAKARARQESDGDEGDGRTR